MNKKKNSILSLFELGNLFSSKIRKEFLILIFLSFTTSFFDVLSVASIIPFITSLPGLNTNNQFDYPFFNLKSSFNPVLESVIILTIVVVIAAVTRIVTLAYSCKITSKFAHIISKEIFNIKFGTSYEYLIKTDLKVSTAELVLYITKTVDSLMHFSKLVTSFFISILISSFLLFTKPLISLSTLFIIGSIYILLGLDSRKRMNTLSKTIARYTENQIQIIQEIYGMSRNLYLDNSFNAISKDYYRFDFKNRNLYAQSEFLGSYPRFVVESLAIIIISSLTFFLIILNNASTQSILPFLGAFAFASQRLLPAIQAIYSNWAGIKANDEFVKNIITSLKEKVIPTNYNLLSNDKKIRRILFSNLTFTYSLEKSNKLIIKDLNYEFNSGDRIAIIGKTGVGKSTLLDMIACLRNPTEGYIDFIGLKDKSIIKSASEDDTLNFKKNIINCALIPQFSYIVNGTYAENISLSNPYEKIDYERLEYAAKISNLYDFIQNNKEGFEFNPTKNGYVLSGGQVQRISIARAIYKMSPILLMDESTSALDKTTSLEIINNVFNQSHIKFIFAITHSNYFLNKFTHILEFKENGQIDITRNKK